LALLVIALTPLAEARVRGKRSKMSVGCIVNTRKDLSLEGQRLFSLYLGSFTVTCELPHGFESARLQATGGSESSDQPNLTVLAKAVQRQTQAIKRDKLYLGAPLEMLFGRLMLPLFSTKRRKKLYQKHYPLWGGITNMNLNTLWPPDEQRPMDYFRAVSTGPVTPLVFSITTVSERINVGLSFRLGVFSSEGIDDVKRTFVEQISSLQQ
jgi:hypothetical protein